MSLTPGKERMNIWIGSKNASSQSLKLLKAMDVSLVVKKCYGKLTQSGKVYQKQKD